MNTNTQIPHRPAPPAGLFRRIIASIALAAIAAFPATALSDYRDDIGYRLLEAQLGARMPTGAAVPVMQVEGTVLADGIETYLPDPRDAELKGKTIADRSRGVPGSYSGHATAVARSFYGRTGSAAPGISAIDAYGATSWLSGFLRISGGRGPQPLSSPVRVANHSWVGGVSAFDAEILRRIDWLIARDEVTHVVGLSNGNPNAPLFGSAYNVIAVGRTTGEHGRGSVAVDSIYTAGRTRPDVVAPAENTSIASPRVAASAALLVEVGQKNAGLSTDPASRSATSRAGNLVRNAARSEVIKAALMAGASRRTANTGASDITDYRASAAHQTSNGLDVRFGAGQVNILHSYAIIAASEQNSLEDHAPGKGQAAASGFDYDPRFGGLGGTNRVATYSLPAQTTSGRLSAALVWNLKIDGGSVSFFVDTATLYNLDLELLDVTDAAKRVRVGYSRSTTENTENLWLPLAAGRRYALQVTGSKDQDDFDWDYALAWHTVPAP